MWAAIKSQHCIGPYFFDGPVNRLTYVVMLHDCLIPEVDRLGVQESAWLQQDRAPAHFALTVRQFLDEWFLNCCIGRGSEASLRHCDGLPEVLSSAHGTIRCRDILKKGCKTRYRTTEELKDVVRQAFATIDWSLLRKKNHRIILCDANDGAHTNGLDN